MESEIKSNSSAFGSAPTKPRAGLNLLYDEVLLRAELLQQ
jgi:hypothetical protein